MNRTSIVPPTAAAVKPTDLGCLHINRRYIRQVTRTRRAAERYQRLLSGQCPECGTALDSTQVWCVGCAPEKGM